jgi:hypothetical protein
VQLDPVKPRFPRASRAFREIVDRPVDLLPGHRLAEKAVERLRRIRRTHSLAILVLDSADILLASRMAELQDQLAVMFVHRADRRPPEGNLVIMVDRGVTGNDPSANADGHE